MTRSKNDVEKKKKRGNDLVNIRDFRRRLEEVTGYKDQHKVEEEADLPYNALTKIYSGNQALTVDHLLALSRVYGISIDDLLGNNVNGSSINVADFMDMIHTLHNMGAIKIQPKANWVARIGQGDDPETINVSSAAILIANANLETIMQEYITIKKGMDVIDGSLKDEVYERWLNSRRESNVSIKGATIPEQEYEKHYYDYEH